MTAALLVPLSAQAESGSQIAGEWTFQTGDYNAGACRISGDMIITPTQDPNVYTCEFTTYEDCSYLSGQVLQECSVRVEGNKAAFVSRVKRIIRQQPEPYSYAPDDWILDILSPSEMTGTLESASRAQVIFTRHGAPTS